LGTKRENNFGKEDISEIPIGYVEIGSREINLNKKNPIPKSPPQAPKISDVSRIWMIRLEVA
jgi:hypothetical protein